MRASLGLLAVITASTLWAVAANVASSLFQVGINAFDLAGIATLIATVALILVQTLREGLPRLSVRPSQFVLGILFVLFVAADYLAIARLPVAVAIVLIFTSPVLVVLWTAIVSRRLPSTKVLIALGLSVIGVALVSQLLAGNLAAFNWFGVSVGLSTALLFAAYTLLSEQISTTYSATTSLLKTFWVASLLWIGYFLFHGFPVTLLESQTLPKVVYMGIAGSLLPYLLYLWGMKHLQAERAAIVATIEPVIAAGIAWIWFGQQLTILQMLGGVLILIAITLLRIRKAS
ncbi:MAG: DMT family transporter [Stenomitos rutilans HA7619-LM2]|nr:DMT family transporter [Stenomitos rutilans HA7619-LM2]